MLEGAFCLPPPTPPASGQVSSLTKPGLGALYASLHFHNICYCSVSWTLGLLKAGMALIVLFILASNTSA